jgi:hypothetical protein
MTMTARPPGGGSERTTPRWARTGSLVAVLMTAGALAASCGGGGSHPAASSSNRTRAPSATTRSAILFDSCIRAHGIFDFPDSAIYVNGGQLEFHIPVRLKVEPEFLPAFQACQKDIPGGGIPPKHVNIREELEFARCMRSHGIADFPDPRPDGGYDITGDTSSPPFEAAAHACRVTGIHWNGP